MIWQTMKMMVPMMTAAMLHRHIWTTVMIWQTMKVMVPMMTVAMLCASFVLDHDILFLNFDAIRLRYIFPRFADYIPLSRPWRT
jgi:hypothetical protein